MIKKLFFFGLFTLIAFSLATCLWSDKVSIPVQGATAPDWNDQSFWYYPWGKSGVHKGVDIFAAKGTAVQSATSGIVVSVGENRYRGNFVLVLGPHMTYHYYAHLEHIQAKRLQVVSRGEQIGTVGDSGNARGKSPHLHYSIFTWLPRMGHLRGENHQAWRKPFYLNPIPLIRGEHTLSVW